MSPTLVNPDATIFGLEPAVAMGIIGSVITSVGIVIANKYLVSAMGFNYVIFLSAIHFFATSLAMKLLKRLGFFESKEANMVEIIKASMATAASVGFMNLNLTYNSVGFYQMSKLLCVPAILVLQYYLEGTTASRNVKLSLMVVLLGVGIATEADMSLNPKGLIMAALAVMSTAIGQIWTGSKQKELQLSPMQLLELSAPYVGLALFVMSPVLDTWYSVPASASTPKAVVGLLDFVWSQEVVVMITFTCLCAIGVNLTNFVIIGKTSPLTYQVIGHAKTCLILLFGVVFFGNKLKSRGVLGVLIALVATIVYTEVKRRESLNPQSSSSNASSTASSVSSKYTAHELGASRTNAISTGPTDESDLDLDLDLDVHMKSDNSTK